MKNGYPGVITIAVADRSGLIRGTVVYDKYFKIFIILVQNRVQTFFQIRFDIVYGDNDGSQFIQKEHSFVYNQSCAYKI